MSDDAIDYEPWERFKALEIPPRAPRRIQRKQSKGWRKPDGVVNVTRQGKWGNPYHAIKDLDWSLREFRKHAEREVKSGRLNLGELRGKDVMCWCRLRDRCHGDIWLEMANK